MLVDSLVSSNLTDTGIRMASLWVKRSNVSKESQREAKNLVKVNKVRLRSSLGST